MSEKLHGFLVDSGNYSKTYEDFSTQFATPESQTKLYEYMTGNNTYTKSQEDFNAQFFSNPVEPVENKVDEEVLATEWKLDRNTMSWMSPDGVVTPRSEVPADIRKIHQKQMKLENVDDDSILKKGLKFFDTTVTDSPEAVDAEANSIYYSIDYFKPSVGEEKKYLENNKKLFDDYKTNLEKLKKLESEKKTVESSRKINNASPAMQMIDPSSGELINVGQENQALDLETQKAKEIEQRILNNRSDIEADVQSGYKSIKKSMVEAQQTYKKLVEEGQVEAKDVTEEKIYELAMELQNKASKDQIFQDNIAMFIEDNQGILTTAKPEWQKKTKKAAETEVLNLDNRKKNNLKMLDFSLGQVESMDLKLRAYEKDFKTRHDLLLAEGEVFNKEFNDNKLNEVTNESSQEEIDQYEDWRARKNTWVEKYNTFKEKEQASIDVYDEMQENRKMHANNYRSATEMQFQINEDGEDLRLYMNAMNRNGHNITAGLTWLTTSATSIAMGLEGMAYNLYELPEDIMFDFYDNDPTKMPDHIRSDYVTDKMVDAWRFAGREKVNKWMQDMNASVQKPTEYADIDDLSDLGAFGLHAVSNFIPQLGVMATMGPSSIYILGASAGGNKFEEYDRSNRLAGTNYSLAEKWMATSIAFGAETLSEKITFDIFKGLGPVAQKQVKNGVLKEAWYQMQQMSWKGVAKSGTRIGMESGSEGVAEILNNLGDITVRGDDKSIFEGVKGAMLTGAFMERSMAMPRVYSQVTSVFGGKDYQAKFGELTAEQDEVGDMLASGNISEDMRAQLEDTWLDLQMQKEEVLASVHENVDQMTDDHKNRLVEIEIENHNIKKKQDKINLDKNLTDKEKQVANKADSRKQVENLAEKNKILSEYESDETKAEKKERLEKQEKQVRKKIAKMNEKRDPDKQISMEIAEDSDAVEELLQADQAMLREEILALANLVKNSDGKEKNKYQKQLAEAKAGLADAKMAAEGSFGFVQENYLNSGQTRIVINKKEALDVKGDVNVIAHEFLHKGLFATIKNNMETQDALGDALLEYTGELDIETSERFNQRLSAYGTFDKDGNYIKDSNFGEEAIAIMSSAIMDGSLKFNEGFFTKIGDIIRQHYRRYVTTDIKFNNGRDVYNFIKDYNDSIEKGYDSKSIDKVFEEGAKGDLIKTAKDENEKTIGKFAQQSKKSAFTNNSVVEDLGLKEETEKIVRRNKELEDLIIKEGKKDADGNIIASQPLQQALVRNNLPRAFALARDAAGKANSLTLEDALKQNDVMEWYSEYSLKLAELARTYKAEMKDGVKVPFGAYMNMLLPLKYSGILDKLKSKVETSSMSDEATAKKVGKKTKKTSVVEKREGTTVALESIGHANVMSFLRDVYSKNKSELGDISKYKDVKNGLVAHRKFMKDGTEITPELKAQYKKDGKKSPKELKSLRKPNGPLFDSLVAVAEIFTDGTFTAEELAKRIITEQDLTADMRKAIQNKILKHSPEMLNMAPYGTSASGDATGIANTVLGEAWYDKKGRTKMVDTGSSKGVFAQVKQGLNMQSFLTPFGVAEAGKRVTNKSVDGALRAWVVQVATIAQNQAIRQQAETDGNLAEVIRIKDGKNDIQFSLKPLMKDSAQMEVFLKGKQDLYQKLAAGFGRDMPLSMIEKILEDVYGKDLKGLKSIAKGLKKIIDIYNPIGVKSKAVRLEDWENFKKRSEQEQMDNIVQSVGYDGKASELYDDEVRVNKQRQSVIALGDHMIEEGRSLEEVAKVMVVLMPAYAGNTQISRKKNFLVDKDGYANKISDSVTTKKNGGEMSTNRKQSFEGKNDWEKNAIAKIGNGVLVDVYNKVKKETTLRAQKADVALKSVNKDGNVSNDDLALINEDALLAQDAIDFMSDFIIQSPNHDLVDLAMFMVSNLSHMEAPIRRAARLDAVAVGLTQPGHPNYVPEGTASPSEVARWMKSKGIEGYKAIKQSKAKKVPYRNKYTVVYEHAIPASDMAFRVIHYKAKNKWSNDFYNQYTVQVIPKAMDNALKESGLESRSNVDFKFSDNVTDGQYGRNYSSEMRGQSGIVPIRKFDGTIVGEDWSRSNNGMSFSKKYDKEAQFEKIIKGNKLINKKPKGISVFDFDETAGISDNVVVARKDSKEITIDSAEWPNVGDKLLNEGWEMDFTDFNRVTNGRPGPLMQKLKNQIKKYGPKNVFILTARAPQSQQAIHEYLKSEGVNIPLENITGLGNSTGEAKADWMVDKLAEGYNDFYFVDDAMQNVKAVKDMLEQFDVKSKVVQARIQFSKKENLDARINEIIEQNEGVNKDARFSDAEARARGIDKGKYKLWIPPGAEDFMGLMYTLASAKGKKGEDQLNFFRKAILVPYQNGIRKLNQSRQELSENYKLLKSLHPDIKKLFKEKIPGTNFTYEHAIRVYLWDQAGFEIPGIAEGTKKKLLDAVSNVKDLQVFADNLGKITKAEKGYVEPSAEWVAGSIIGDLSQATEDLGRKDFLAEFNENVEVIFSKENLNKIEAVYGRDYRDALENILFRMKTGRNKIAGTSDAQVNRWTTWITNSVGAIMFMNMRSALLQTISAINFINWGDNNPVKAAMAFANQKQFWSDFSMIFNSPYLKERRTGLKTDVNEAQLANAVAGKKNKATAALAYLLKLGFTPTQIADSFAIAVGGASFYRNRVNSLMKEGMSKEEAEAQAFADMQDVANESQQSSDPALISRQQASILGRFILAFQNTPMQYARLTKKAAIDLIKGRGDWKTNVSKIVYYSAI